MVTKAQLIEHFPKITGKQIGECFKTFKRLGKDSTDEFLLNVAGQILDGVWSFPKQRIPVLEGSALDLLLQIQFCPSTQEGFASRSEKRRILEQRAVRINGAFPGPDDLIEFPVEDLVFFPNGKRKTTIR